MIRINVRQGVVTGLTKICETCHRPAFVADYRSRTGRELPWCKSCRRGFINDKRRTG